jgi:3-oxoacid CoA-transferase subunit B
VITDLAVIGVTPAGLELREVAPGIDPGAVVRRTEAPLQLAPDLRMMDL